LPEMGHVSALAQMVDHMKSSHAHRIESRSPIAGRGGELRASGIPVLNEMPWGTHICLFYDTELDLLETNAAYFEAGLQANECCIWALHDPVDFVSATEALRRSIPDIDGRLKSGQIKLVSGTDWYFRGGKFDLKRLTGGWAEKVRMALAQGFAGLRLSGNAFWVGTNHWKNFLEYEHQLNRSIAGKKMIVLCTYSLSKSRTVDLLDVARVHQFTLARRNGAWEFLETPQLTHARRGIRNAKGALDALPDRIFPGHENLTSRERAVLAEIVRGLSSKEIARVLDITPRTVEFHRANLLKKTSAKSTVDLMRIVLGE
jgi:DNA-binding CsgD family transcriptional regulator